jgi:hypothetical protein
MGASAPFIHLGEKMASFTNQVQYKTGDLTSYTSQMDVWLDDGVKDVVDRASTISPHLQRLFQQRTDFGSSGYDISTTSKIIHVFRNVNTDHWVPAPLSDCTAVSSVLNEDADSIYFGGDYAPVSTIIGGKLYVYPAPSTTSTGARVVAITYGVVDDTSGSITNMPSNFYDGVVLYAAVRSQEYRVGLELTKISGLTTTIASYVSNIAGFSSKFDEYITGESTLPADVQNMDELLAKLEDYIQTDEDTELANATINNIQILLSRYKAELDGAGLNDSSINATLKEAQNIAAAIQAISGKIQSLRAEYVAFFERIVR